METHDPPYVACHIRPNATAGQRRPSRRSPAGSAPRKPPATGTPSAATPPPRKSTDTRSSPPSATPSPAPPGYRQSRPTPELHPKPVTQRYKHVTRAPECLRSLSQHQYCASILRPLPNCALLDQGGAAKRRRGAGPPAAAGVRTGAGRPPGGAAAGRDASASLRPWGPRSARARPWLLGRLLINQPIATTARVEAAKPTHLLARASPGRKSYSAVRSRQAAANRMILWPVPSARAQPTRAEPLSVQSIKQPQLDLHSRLHNPAPIG